MFSSGVRSTVLAAGLVALVAPARGEEPTIAGAWRLVSYVREEVGGGAPARPWGENPRGYLLLLPSGHMSMVITAEGRTPVSRDDDQYEAKSSKLMHTMTAYAGTYTRKGDTLVFHVEAAGEPDWVGTDQTRLLAFDRDEMTFRSQPILSWTTGKMSVFITKWRRAG